MICQFVLHVRTAVQACKQMGLEANFNVAAQAHEGSLLDADVAKQAYARECNAVKKKCSNLKGGTDEYTPANPKAETPLAKAKAEYKVALKAVEVATSAMEIAGAKACELYRNLLSDEAVSRGRRSSRRRSIPTLWKT